MALATCKSSNPAQRIIELVLTKLLSSKASNLRSLPVLMDVHSFRHRLFGESLAPRECLALDLSINTLMSSG